MALCTVTGTLRDPSGTLLPAAAITFTRSGVQPQDGSTTIPNAVVAVANISGVLTVTLYSGKYSATTSGNGGTLSTFGVNVPTTATATLSNLI